MVPSKLAVFVDGANLYATGRALGFDVDFKRLLHEFCSRGQLVRAHYYTPISEDQDFSNLRSLIDWLAYNGFSVHARPTKEFTDPTGRRRFRGHMDVDLTVDALELADHIDQLFLFSGDIVFKALIAALQRRGVRVIVVSTIATQPAIVSDELRRQADDFIDLSDLRSRIERKPPVAVVS